MKELILPQTWLDTYGNYTIKYGSRDIRHRMVVDPVGSKITCFPEPDDNNPNHDSDYLLYFTGQPWEWLTQATQELAREGWMWSGSMDKTGDSKAYGREFISMFKEGVNIICTTSQNFYTGFMAATHVCRTLNLPEKDQRIAVFEAVMYHKKFGHSWRDVPSPIDLNDPFAEDWVGPDNPLINEHVPFDLAVSPIKRKRKIEVMTDEHYGGH